MLPGAQGQGAAGEEEISAGPWMTCSPSAGAEWGLSAARRLARTCSSGIRGSQGRGARGSSSRSGGVTRRAEYRPTGLRRGSFPVPFSALSPFSPEQRTPRSDLKGRFQPAQGGQRTPGHVHRKGSTSSSLPVSTAAPTAVSRFAGTTHRARHRRACTCVGFLPGNGFRVFGSGFGEA